MYDVERFLISAWIFEICEIEVDGFKRRILSSVVNQVHDVCYFRFEFSALEKDGKTLDYSDSRYYLWSSILVNLLIGKFDDGSDVVNLSGWRTVEFVNGIGRRINCSLISLDASFYLETYLSFDRNRKLGSLGI